MRRSSWERRIERAAELEGEYPEAAEVLRFYQEIAKFQRASESQSQRSDFIATQMPHLIALVREIGPPALAEAANRLGHRPVPPLPYGRGSVPPQNRGREGADFAAKQVGADDAESALAFFSRVLQQVQMACRAVHSDIAVGARDAACPFCHERPVVAALRPEGEGGKRGLVCSLCFTEWGFRRLLCPNCGEEDHQKLPVYKTKEFPHIRVEACDSCRHYLKSVDLTVNGHAVPEVDELAAISLDLWAEEKDYTKIMPNLLGF
jgi:FdhE protein